jgi:hypothetical protein
MKAVLAAILIVSMMFECQAAVRSSSRNFQSLADKKKQEEQAKKAKEAEARANAQAQKTQQAENKGAEHITFMGPETGWGFVKKSCPYYTTEGKNQGKMTAGTLFKYDGVKQTKKSSVLVSTVKDEDGTWKGPYLLDCTAIAAYEGSPDTIDPKTVEALGKYFTLSGKIEDRKAEITDEKLKDNPYFQAAKSAQDVYLASVKKATELENEMNAATGPHRSKLQDQLRALKYEQVKIQTKSEAQIAAYRNWKAEHPIDPQEFTNDAQIKAWTAERDSTAASVKNLIPEDK